MSRFKRLIIEVHRRSLWQVLLIYIGAAWACFELIDAVTERFGFPEWLPALAVVLFLLGLPFVVATACVHELPARAEPPVEGEAGEAAEAAAARHETRRRHRFLTWRNAAATFVIVLAAWGVVAAGWLLLGERVTPEEVDARKSIAVLPFVNLSENRADEFFSDGVTVEIIDRLSKIADLTVKSRTSSFQYKETDKSHREIGDELGVLAVLEGEVRRAGDRVRINAQLIDADTDEHLWSEQYDRELTDVFAIQTDVAQQVAAAVGAELTAAERERIEARPTENLEAYEYYLRGNERVARSQEEHDYRTAVQMFERAVELDPEFALAFALLSEVHTFIHWMRFDASAERLASAKEAVERAFLLEPNLPEAHRALGYYYYQSYLDYDRALEEFAIAAKSLPNDPVLWLGIGAVQRRQGRFDQALLNLEKTVELDPRSARSAYNLGQTYALVRDYPQGVRHFDRASALNPEWSRPYGWKARCYLSLYGTTREALSVLDQASLIVRDTDDPYFVRDAVLIRAFDGRYRDAIGRLESLSEETLDTQFFFFPKSLLMARIYFWINRPEAARAYYDTARAIIERQLQEMPDDHRAHSSLGLAYAGLGRKEAAIREGMLALELMPVSKEAWKGAFRVADLARIYAVVGEHDAAIDQLDYLLSIPGEESVNLLRIDPSWDPLRNHPRFQALLEKYE
ncbi:MAG: tetratricopeptide repeat protein [Gemmatimonadota bacterium]|nr:MAG: tetratricopeptide repeat protein [Gemmatimonadota bacterium]